MAREHRVLRSLWQIFPLAPRSLYLCEDPHVLGAAFQLLEYRPGLIMRGAELPRGLRNFATSRRLSTMMVETLAKIHGISLDSAGLGDLGQLGSFLERTARGWIARGSAVLGSAPSAGARTLVEWLERASLTDSGPPALLHNDFKLDNLILDPTTLKPVAVIDWDMATRGDPLFDLATLLSYWTEPGDPDCMTELGQMPTAHAGFQTREQAATTYMELTGRAIDHFQVHRVLAIFKLGVVFHQLHTRYAAEGSTDPRHARFAAIADRIFDFGVEIAVGRVF
jgi:aminoglycoside phosphotransferase (APT) family kinase protein